MKKLNTINKIRSATKLFGLAVAASAAFVAGNTQAATIWTNRSTTFTKANYADWTLPRNQDQLTDNVWITRGDSGQIFNIAPTSGEISAGGWTSDSPKDTEWAWAGGNGNPSDVSQITAANYAALNFVTFDRVYYIARTSLADVVNRKAVVHLITDDIYLDVQFTSWTQGAGGGTARGGGFSYTRSTAPILWVKLDSPADTGAYPSGTSITATASVGEPNATLTDTVTFHTTPIAPAGSTVDTVSTNTTSPFTAVLGALPEGTYEIYATVTNNDTPPGNSTSTTNTFTVAAGIPTTTTLISAANPSTYGQCTLTVTVAPPPTGGTVQFYVGASAFGSPVAVDTVTGEAQISANTLGAGTNDLTAAYSGHGLNGASTSDVLTQVVDKAELMMVKALDVLRAPNTANPDPLPYQLFGFQNGETLATSGVTGTPTLTTTAVRSSPVGTYDITCALGSLAAANYSFTNPVNGTLTVAVVGNIFGINFYVGPDWPYGGMTTDEQKANVLLAPSMPAGLGDWYATGWQNILVPWGGGQPPVTLTSTRGSTATFIFKDCRNGWTYDGPRTTLLGDGNGNMMDAKVNSTLDPGDGSNLFDMEVTNIPFASYDVIFYMGSTLAQYYDGTGSIVFNGGAERAFTIQPGAFDGTFTEMVDATTPGNYIVYTGVTGSSFTTQTWGNGFNHIGPFGIQIRDAAPTVLITGITGPDLSGKFTIAGASSGSAKVGLFRSTAVNAPLAGAGWTQEGASQTGTSFSFTGTGGGTQAFFILQVVP